MSSQSSMLIEAFLWTVLTQVANIFCAKVS